MRDVLYQYDGTFDGFLCCIHDSYLYKEIPVGFSSDGDFLSLYEVRIVPTQAAHSQRVYRGLAARSNKAANGSAPSRARAWKIADFDGGLYD